MTIPLYHKPPIEAPPITDERREPSWAPGFGIGIDLWVSEMIQDEKQQLSRGMRF
jgi:hypothetical protein